MTNQRQLPPLKGQSEMCANLSLSLCVSALLLLIQYVFFEPPRASLCLKLQVMVLFTLRKDHTERKGLAEAQFAVYYSIFPVKTLTDRVFFLFSCGEGGSAAISAF